MAKLIILNASDILVKMIKESEINSFFLMYFNMLTLHQASKKMIRQMKESILSYLSKVLSKVIYVAKFIPKKIFSKYHCGRMNGFNAQYCLMILFKKLCDLLDSKDRAFARLTNPLKRPDYIDHKLLIAKLNAYWTLHSTFELFVPLSKK